MAKDTENAPEASLDALTWALRFIQDYEKKLLKRAIQIAKAKRHSLQKIRKED